MSASSDERFNVWEVPFVAADNKKYKGRSDLNLSEDEINTRVADEQTCPALQLILYHRSQFDDSQRKRLLERFVDSSKEHELLRRHSPGDVNFSHEPPRFFFRTPSDGSLWCSYSARVYEISGGRKVVRAIISSGAGSDGLRPQIKAKWKYFDIPLILFPLEFLRVHAKQQRTKLAELDKSIREVEDGIANEIDIAELRSYIKQLHECNRALIKLERRWRFQAQLAESVQEFLNENNELRITGSGEKLRPYRTTSSSVAPATDDDGDRTYHYLGEDKDLREIESIVTFEARYIKTSEYDISVLPRRIDGSFTAIYNLIAQQDAQQSVKLARAALFDSLSMKTIAAMTLVFLPATFVCAFFSMTFFDWQAQDRSTVADSIWIFVAVTVPLTVIIVAIWLRYTRRARKRFDEEAQLNKEVQQG